MKVDWAEYGETVKEVGSGLQLQATAVGSEGEKYRGADKSLARPGRKQATATEDFDVNISYFLS